MSSALHDYREAQTAYFRLVMHWTPADKPTSSNGETYPWTPPDANAFESIRTLGASLTDTLSTFGSYIYDMQIEMQNLLLGDLFPYRVPLRQPLDPKYVVVRLDRSDELKAYFETQTPYGKRNIEIGKSLDAGSESGKRRD